MKKSSIIGIVMGLVAVAGLVAGGLYFFAFDDVEALRKAVNGQGSVTCTMVSAEDDEEVDIFARNGEVLFVVDGQTITHDFFGDQEDAVNHTLFKDDVVYSWSEGGTEGIKFEAEEGGETIFTMAENEEEFRSEIEENSSEITCRRGASRNHFQVPEGVDFKTPEELFPEPSDEDFEFELDDEEIEFEEDNSEES